MKRLFQERGCGEARQSDPVVGQRQRVVDNKPVWPDHASNTDQNHWDHVRPGTQPGRRAPERIATKPEVGTRS